MPDQSKTRKRRWPKWIFALLVLLFLVMTVVYVIAKRTATNDIATQLNALDLGRHELGSVSVGIDGVVANQIQFFRNNDPADQPWLTVDRLIVEHPIVELAQGVSRYNAIELAGVKANVDALSFDSGADTAFDFSQLELPAKQIRLTDAQVSLVARGKPTLAITDIQLQLNQTGEDPLSLVTIEGRIGDLLGSAVEATGLLGANNQQLNLTLTTDQLDVTTEQWKSLPGLPKNIETNFTADGKLDTLRCGLALEDNEFVIDGTAKIADLAIGLPKFDLPISVSQGNIHFDSKKIKVTELNATVDGRGTIQGQAETSIAQFPVLTTFDTEFKNVSSTSLRKLVPAVPEILAANISGTASGAVSVEHSTRTTINLTANGVSTDGAYGKIKAKQIDTNVKIQELVFDASQNYESIDGAVTATAKFEAQPIPSVLETFELESLQQQLEFVGNGSGVMNFRLPLATAEDLRTWEIGIKGNVPAGSVAGQRFIDASTSVEMNGGVLQFNPVELTAINGNEKPVDAPVVADSNLKLDVRCPIASETNEPDQISLLVTGANVPLPWVNGFLQNQMHGSSPVDQTAGPDSAPSVGNSTASVTDLDKLTGGAGFEISLTIPTATPDDLMTWHANGNVKDSQINVGDQQLRDLSGLVQMEKGQLRIDGLNGDFYNQATRNGSVSGTAQVDLQQLTQTSVGLNFEQLPLPWLVSVAREALPQFSQQLKQPVINSLSGQIDASVNYQPTHVKGQTPSLQIVAKSKEISVSGQLLNDFKLNGSLQNNQLELSKLSGRIGSGGKIDASGNWSIQANQATGKLKWNQVPLAALSGLKDAWPTAMAGTSSGGITVSTPNGVANIDQYLVNGAIGLKELQVQLFKARDIGFDIVTKNGELLLENFRNANGKIDVDLDGKLTLTAPHRFEVDAKINKLSVTELLSSFTSVDDEIDVAQLTGVLRGGFKIDGQVTDFDWQTTGNILCAGPTYNGVELDDIKAKWKILKDDRQPPQFIVESFGGVAELRSFSRAPETAKLKIANIDAAQLTTVFEIPAKFTGRINGQASLKNWSQPKKRVAKLKVAGESMLVGAAELGDLQLVASYQNESVEYDLSGSVFNGKLTAIGSKSLKPTDLVEFNLPLEVTLTNASMAGLKSVTRSSSLEALSGRVSAKADVELALDGSVTAEGRLAIAQAKWNRELVTRQGSVHFKLTDDRIVLDDLDVDLKRGVIAGQATIPLSGGTTGRYEISVRNLDLERLSELAHDDLRAKGLLDGRLTGQVGRQVTGRGFVGVHRASVNGVAGQSLRLPIQFQLAPLTGAGKLELRRTSFRVFDGNASGRAAITFGNSLNVDVDMNFSNVDTEKMLAEMAGVKQADQGKLTGRLLLTGHGVRSTRQLKGSFRGSLQRVSAFELPVLSDVARLLSVTNLQSTDFDSDTIELLLSNNQINVKQFNFSSSLVKIAITGQAFLDGRLNLSAAARVENLQQPTLLDELAGSPLASLSPVAAASNASEFLSERLVFIKINGNFKRPQVRVDTGQQLKNEAIRYFLPGSNILPYLTGRNN